LGSDLFVLPSMNENFGLAIFEALYYGMPVLISKNVYLWEDIVKGGVGWACDYSVQSFSEKLIEVLQGRADFESKKKQGLVFANKFTPESLANTYMQFYRNFMRNNFAE